ncbi:MAG: ATP-binding protein [Saprospiraceae bacterium]
MENTWISPDTIIGDAATGHRYIRRPYINDEFWRQIEKGNHILLVAPRRVGKTSIMKDLAQSPMEGYVAIYKNIEAERTANGLYKRVFEMIIECFSRQTRFKKQIAVWLKRYKISSIGEGGIAIDEKEINYRLELNNLLNDLENQPVKILLLIDEIPEVLNNMRKQGRAEEAIETLHNFREFNLNEQYKKISIVYAGSIGLSHIVQALDARPAIINHLNLIPIDALTAKEADQLITQITDGATIQYDANDRAYLYQKIQYLLPFFVQLMVEEIDRIARRVNKTKISQSIVDEAFENIIEEQFHFDDWHRRLKEYFSKEEFEFLKTLLSYCAHKGAISIQQVYDMALQTGIDEDDYSNSIEILKRDGYLKEVSNLTYDFTSPFLKGYWLKKYPLYHVR